ncbi:amidohydrolase [Kineococcus sp. SYSU DK018]|uniref:amidohydrolase n=1 Tax=Kineococcus sp. SYSU DK018 TaxID=3383139 RepID=UPI003D7D5CBD
MSLLLTGGHVETFDPAGTTGTAIAVRDGRVLAVGADAEVQAAAGPGARRTDLAGATVWPGFIDTHMHLEKVSHELTMLRLEDARSLAELLEIVGERARATAHLPDPPWIRCFADNAAWNEANLTEGRLPTRTELDAVTGGVPTYLYRRPDRGVLNSAGAGRVAGKLTGSPDGYDPGTGWLTGPLVRVVNDSIYTLSTADPERRQRILADACRTLLRHGITSVADPGLAGAFEPAWQLYTEARRRGTLVQRVRLMNRVDWRRPLTEELDRVRAGTSPVAGDDRLAAWGVKLLLDGEFTTAWMRGGEEIPGSRAHYTPGELRSLVAECADRGWPLTVHAMGGGAIGAVLEAVDRALRGGHRLLPGQVKIAHAFLIDSADVDECLRLGVGVSVNPPLGHVYSGEIREAWGPLGGRAMPLRTMARLGLRFAAGSDTHPISPLHGAAIAAQRRAWDGSDLGGHEALEPRRAVEMYTRDAGEHLGVPGLGTLAPGAPADLVVWPVDPLSTDVGRWPDLEPSAVLVDGRPAPTADPIPVEA